MTWSSCSWALGPLPLSPLQLKTGAHHQLPRVLAPTPALPQCLQARQATPQPFRPLRLTVVPPPGPLFTGTFSLDCNTYWKQNSIIVLQCSKVPSLRVQRIQEPRHRRVLAHRTSHPSQRVSPASVSSSSMAPINNVAHGQPFPPVLLLLCFTVSERL